MLYSPNINNVKAVAFSLQRHLCAGYACNGCEMGFIVCLDEVADYIFVIN